MVWFKGPREPEFGNGDRLAVVTPLGGAGVSLEGVGDQPGFQVRMMAREFELAELKLSVYAVDRELLLGQQFPADIWGTRIQYVTRTGGGPSPLQEDEFDRVVYVCSYAVHETT